LSIGLTGSHRTGKTTLAKAFAEKFEMHLCVTSASHVFQTLGYSPQVDYPIDIRLDIQEAILAVFAIQYKEASIASGRSFITDRTPIDLMAYTLADIGRQKMTEEQEMRLKRYIRACIDLCNVYFSVLVVVQPGIEIVADETKAPTGYGYIEHISQIIMGLTVSEKITASHFYIPARITGLKERVHCVEGAVKQTVGRIFAKMDDSLDSDGYAVVH
jgi:predicted ATPase